ncbi:type II toxin-antitoxin system RelE/ParE family toxin [Streptomyces globosus]|uniref:Type II toxin-antitoxin system RelE/ParE family toxin n=1 Tax=Streptomyces globosus TaxID=68209 RepID=A0A344U1U0_9ACTN|nr:MULTISPECIES: type II toxin-antitoxin system RelE/ParE family toxin [Streptomyces]AXE24861.1 type II toxin-antitoxin system RelE/ParE family toxin [Streptomyces globosus]
MPYAILWDEAAIDAAAGFMADDPEGLRQLMYSVDLLAAGPRPQGTVEYGSPRLRRMHVGRYRVLYEVVDASAAVVLFHVGRLG